MFKGFALLILAAVSVCADAPQPARSALNCEWPQTASRNLGQAWGGRHLTRDAELAEDLAIRYADACCGPHSGHFENMSVWGQKRDECMTKLFRIIARNDGVTEVEVRRSLLHRALGFDTAVILSFGVLYALAAYLVVSWLWAQYMGDGKSSAMAILTIYASAIVSAAGVLFVELWSLALETVRIGNGHLSDRTYRIPWLHHRPALFITGVLVFWIVVALRYLAPYRPPRSS